MDNNVFWEKLSEMDYSDILQWAKSEGVQAAPCRHNSCLLADLAMKVTGEEWSFAGAVWAGPDFGRSANMGEATPTMLKIMEDFDNGELLEFVDPSFVRTEDGRHWYSKKDQEIY